MKDIINEWSSFRDIIQNNSIELVFNPGLDDSKLMSNKEFVNHYLPSELYHILCTSNGQTIDSIAIFIELRNNILRENVIRYKFLSLDSLIQTYNYMQHCSKGKIDSNFIPFAIHSEKVGDKGSISLTIHRLNKKIYKTRFYEYDRFTTISDYSSEQISESLYSFLENQILWYDFLK